ncbi:unnamed protein product [Sphagnum jensenii]|uniref:C-terminal of Roc (COR) domain-containing protein n=1 Tax=Sphagnum jensenii TaxID=128206 RepID=A0ABP1AI94_9BRYO
MDLPAVQVRVIREVSDLEKLIAELTSLSCTLEALKVEKGEGVEPLAFVEGGDIRERFANALGASITLKSLDVAFCSDMLKVDDLCRLLQSNEVLKSLMVCSRFARSRSVADGDRSLRVMLEQNSTLKRLGIAHLDGERWDLTEVAGVLGWQSLLEQLVIEFHDWLWVVSVDIIFEMLAVNTNFRCLELTCNFNAVDNALSAVFSRKEGSDHQANERLTRLVLPLDFANTIATILRSNQTIRKLVLTEKQPSPPEYIVILLQALEKNNTLRLLDLSGCSAVQERQDIYDAILNCLKTKPWLHLNLQDTPLSESESRFTTIQQKLQQNAKFREAFGNWNPQWVNSTGKTALRQSLMRSNALNHSGPVACIPLFSLSTSWAQDRNNGILFHRNQDERTRGIEISVMKGSDTAMSIWDLAGQEEYHAFHDYMMPSFGDVVNPCSFLFLFDPTREVHVGEKNRSRKESKVLEEELIYWLQFIASNTPTSIAFPPQLTVILTHADKYLHGGLVEWAEQVVQNARTTFKDIVNISPNIYALNARSTNDVRPVLDFLFESSQQLLKEMPPVFVEGTPHETDNGFATKPYMERILAQSFSRAIRNTPTKGGIHLQPNDLMRLMLNLDICYERDHGNLDAGIYIPTILDAYFSITEREKIVEGSRQMTWPPSQEQNPKWVFFGRRLEYKDRIRTFLTPGFFPRLQV